MAENLETSGAPPVLVDVVGQPYFLWITFLIINIAIFWILYRIFTSISIRDIVAEKVDTPRGGDPREQTSSARVISFFGGMVVAMFLWAALDVVVYLGVVAPDQVQPFLTSINGYVVPAAALFFPYAVNRIADVVKTGQKLEAATEQSKQAGNGASPQGGGNPSNGGPSTAPISPQDVVTATQQTENELNAAVMPAGTTVEVSKVKELLAQLRDKLAPQD